MSFIDASLVDAIEFKQWTTTDGANLETRVFPAEDFEHSDLYGKS